MRKLLASLSIIGALLPSLASAAPIHVVTFDTLSGNGSLYARVQDDSIDPRVREIHTNLLNGAFDEWGYSINKGELLKYARQYECAARIDLTKCKPLRSK